jgi:hypothetical protein
LIGSLKLRMHDRLERPDENALAPEIVLNRR